MNELNFEDRRFDWPDWGDGDVLEFDDIRLTTPGQGWENVEFPQEEGD